MESIIEKNRKHKIIDEAILSFNSAAEGLEHSYRLLYNQVEVLRKEVEEKNLQLRKNLEEGEKVKNFLSNILESLPTGVITTDLKGNILMCNSAVEKITGINPVKISAKALEKFKRDLKIENRTASRSSDIEFSKQISDIRSLKILRSPVINNPGEKTGIIFIIQDQTQLKRLEKQTERDERLKAMGEMAIKIAHEVRNPLGSIELFASILKNELKGQKDLSKLADHIISSVKSLDGSISNLLLFTQSQKPSLTEINLSNVLEEFAQFISPVVEKNGVKLLFSKPEPPCLIYGDKDLLRQVFLNLALNSIQAMEYSGKIRISSRYCHDEENTDNCWIEITFKDNGTGIAKNDIKKIFNPFYSTREKGTGLGLAIVHNIIESHRATIDVTSRQGHGTSITISLPVTKILSS